MSEKCKHMDGSGTWWRHIFISGMWHGKYAAALSLSSRCELESLQSQDPENDKYYDGEHLNSQDRVARWDW